MSTSIIPSANYGPEIRVTNIQADPHWFAAHTLANHEKKVAAELQRRELESFLPLCKSVRRWSDRRQLVAVPLFPGYVFVRLALRDRLRVLQVPGVARLVGFGGVPTPLPDEQIETLRSGWREELRCEPQPYLAIGWRVRVIRGPLTGAEGTLVRKKGGMRLVISVEAIMRSVAVEIEAADVEPLSQVSLEAR